MQRLKNEHPNDPILKKPELNIEPTLIIINILSSLEVTPKP